MIDDSLIRPNVDKERYLASVNRDNNKLYDLPSPYWYELWWDGKNPPCEDGFEWVCATDPYTFEIRLAKKRID